MSAAHDPFIKLTHLWTEDGAHKSSPFYIQPESVRTFYNGRVYLVGETSFQVSEKAEQIHQLVVAKLAENKEADTLGKS